MRGSDDFMPPAGVFLQKRSAGFEPFLASLRRVVSARPALYFPLRAWRRPGTVPGPGTDLVIEGFPRSGNTWAEHLIRHAGPDLQLAHHAHAVAPLRYACRRGVPALVVIRPPAAAVQSLLRMQGGRRSAGRLLADYCHFYRHLAHLRGVFVARFETVTGDPGAVLAALNTRFDLGLAKFDLETDVTAIRAAMDRSAASRRGQHQTGAHPEGRTTPALEIPLPKAPLARAQACYERITADV